jgi:DNA-binding NarL/FixJ family response regulator
MEAMMETGNHEQRRAVQGRPRLLLADDDPIVHSALGAQLQHAFEFVGAAKDADEAIAMTEAHRPDVAILDVNMPGGGAHRATREIRTRCPRTAIVILSADERDGEVLDLLGTGAVAYLRKGLDTHALIGKLFASIEAHGTLAPTA